MNAYDPKEADRIVRNIGTSREKLRDQLRAAMKRIIELEEILKERNDVHTRESTDH